MEYELCCDFGLSCRSSCAAVHFVPYPANAKIEGTGFLVLQANANFVSTFFKTFVKAAARSTSIQSVLYQSCGVSLECGVALGAHGTKT